jgi:hypothetical protein
MTLRFVTLFYVTRHVAILPAIQSLRGIVIGNKTYYEGAKILRALRISRQTLWLWRKDQLIPAGSLHRNRLVFSDEETAQIVAHAARVEPVELRDTKAQMKLPL